MMALTKAYIVKLPKQNTPIEHALINPIFNFLLLKIITRDVEIKL